MCIILKITNMLISVKKNVALSGFKVTFMGKFYIEHRYREYREDLYLYRYREDIVQYLILYIRYRKYYILMWKSTTSTTEIQTSFLPILTTTRK